MSTKFHINKHGIPALCSAKDGNCPLGEVHFSTEKEAEEHLERVNKKDYDLLPGTKNKLKLLNEKLEGAFSKSDVEILNKLNSSGHQAYFVGGSLRDATIDLPINDVDITTSATPEEVIQVFSEYQSLPIGIEHGTVVLIYEGEQIEITTFREDGEYSDSRRPDDVTFTKSLDEDVKRRDFTINSLAYNPKEGLVDLEDGVADIDRKLIRAVGNPDDRFTEDPLRMMRGLRFASKLDFDIEDETEKSIFRNKELLKSISSERLREEFDGLLMGKNAKEVLTKYSSVIAEFIPEIKPMIGFEQNNPNHLYDVWEHSAVVVENAEDNKAHKLAAIFHDVGKPGTYTEGKDGVGHFIGHGEKSVEIAEQALANLKYDNKTKERVLNLIEDHDKMLSTKKYKIAKDIFYGGPDRLFDSLSFKRADDMGKDLNYNTKFDKIDEVESIARDYMADNPILSHKDLSIKPKDIMDLGFKGKEIGDILEHLSLQVMSGHKNDKESQIKYITKNSKIII